jgi:homoserine dehydrogenase
VGQQDVVNATELGYRIKLLAIAKASEGALELRVNPTMIPAGSPLAAVSGVFNAVFITGDNVGDLMFYGRGAGQLPTASAIWSDTIEIARRVAHGIPALDTDLPSTGRSPLPLRPVDDIRSAYYLRVMAMDRPGVLAQVAGILGQHDISLVSVLQKERARHEAVPVVMMTHEARERDMRAALAAIDRLPVVAARTTMIRVEA